MNLAERLDRAIDYALAPRPVTLPILAVRIAWGLLSLGVIYAVGYYLAARLTPFGA
mgnify:CR=1 FL=1